MSKEERSTARRAGGSTHPSSKRAGRPQGKKSAASATTAGKGPDDVVDLQRVLGERLRAARLAAGMTQAELAALLGGPASHVSAIERGEQNVTLSTLARLAEAVGMEPFQLLLKQSRLASVAPRSGPTAAPRVTAWAQLLQLVAREVIDFDGGQRGAGETAERMALELERIVRDLRGQG